MKEKIKSKFSIAGILLLILGIISIIGKYNIANNDGNLSQSIYHLEKYIADFDTKFEILANNNTIDSFDFVKNNKFIDDNNKEYILLLYDKKLLNPIKSNGTSTIQWHLPLT